jgi:3-oxoacyl-[acyl-carrier protein] reductase
MQDTDGFSAVRSRDTAGNTRHLFRPPWRKLLSGERDYMYALQVKQVCSLQRRTHFDAKVQKSDGFRVNVLQAGLNFMGEKPLSGQTAVVTGAGRGIGAAIAEKLAFLGASVVLCGRTETHLQATASAISAADGIARSRQCDITDSISVDALATWIEQTFGRLDIVVNNAGVGSFTAPLHELTPEEWEKVLNTNLRGVFYCIRAFAPLMIRRKSGHIINISSLAGKNALPNGAAYAASKWGLNGLSYSVAEELRTHNIRVSVVCPGSVDTELSPHEGKNPNKMLKPDDVAHVVAMLVQQAPQSFVSEVLIRPTQRP